MRMLRIHIVECRKIQCYKVLIIIKLYDICRDSQWFVKQFYAYKYGIQGFLFKFENVWRERCNTANSSKISCSVRSYNCGAFKKFVILYSVKTVETCNAEFITAIIRGNACYTIRCRYPDIVMQVFNDALNAIVW